MQRNISKKPIIILGSLLTLLIVVTIIYGILSAKNKELKLEQLIDTSYEVLDVRRHKKEKTYEVDIQAELSYADNILLANKLLKELEQYDQTNAVKLNMNVYQQKRQKIQLISPIKHIAIPLKQMVLTFINTSHSIQRI